MRLQRLGKTELQLSVVGLGTWAIGGSGWRFGWGPQDDNDSIATIRRALELGINWIDTAPVYGLGRAEVIVGKALSEVREKPIIATKCGLLWDEHKNIRRQHDKKSVRLEVEMSLKRLGVDVIDLYQIHWPEPDEQIEEAWETLAELQSEGKIRYAGVCNFNVPQLKRAEKIHPVASLQPPYSMIERNIETEILPYCKEKGVGVIAYSPLQKGILTDKFTRHFVESLPADDHRLIEDPCFRQPLLDRNLEFVDALRALASKRNLSVAELAIAWVLNNSTVTAAIAGARKSEQIEQTVKAASIEIKDSDLSVINMLLHRLGI